MQKTIFISLAIEDLETVIIDCVNACLRNSKLFASSDKDSEDILTTEQAAQFLNLSPHTVYSKVCRRELPSMKRGKKLYFSKVELLNYLKEGKKKSVEELQNEAEHGLINPKKGLKDG